MAFTDADFNMPSGQGGILPSQPSHKFRVIPNIRHDIASAFSQQVVDVKFDFVKKRLTIVVRASVSMDSFISVMLCNQSKTAPQIDLLDDNCHPIFSFLFSGSEIIRHELDFSYTTNEALTHAMEWSFEDFTVH